MAVYQPQATVPFAGAYTAPQTYTYRDPVICNRKLMLSELSLGSVPYPGNHSSINNVQSGLIYIQVFRLSKRWCITPIPRTISIRCVVHDGRARTERLLKIDYSTIRYDHDALKNRGDVQPTTCLTGSHQPVY